MASATQWQVGGVKYGRPPRSTSEFSDMEKSRITSENIEVLKRLIFLCRARMFEMSFAIKAVSTLLSSLKKTVETKPHVSKSTTLLKS